MVIEDIKARGGWQRHPTRDIRGGGHEIDVIVTPFEQPTGLETILNHGSRQELIRHVATCPPPPGKIHFFSWPND